MDQFQGILFGGLLTVLGGALGAVLLGRIDNAREERRRASAHRAAVRAVLYELSQNLVVALHPTFTGSGSTAAYDSLAVQLYSDLPDEVAAHVSEAYAMIHATGLTARSMTYAKPGILEGQEALREYSTKTLKLRFMPPESAEDTERKRL